MPIQVAAHSIEVGTSPIHGRGVYATRALAKGTCIGLYEGRRYSSEQLLKVDWHKRHGGIVATAVTLPISTG